MKVEEGNWKQGTGERQQFVFKFKILISNTYSSYLSLTFLTQILTVRI